MHFKDMPYSRITYEEVEQRYRALQEEFRHAGSAEACMAVIRKRYALIDDLTVKEICHVRHDMNVNDPFYAAEKAYYDEIGPKILDLSNQFDKLLLESPFRPELEKILGPMAFPMMEEAQKSFDERLIPLAQEENVLISQYKQIVSNATVLWEGKQIKRNRMSPYTKSEDRETRRKASLAVSDSWEAQRNKLEEIYDKIVCNRQKQAEVMGYANYMELSYHLMTRIGYGPEDVARFREQVKQHLVPFLGQLQERRRIRLGLDHLYSYDGGLYFLNGNPTVTGTTEDSLEATRKMYTEMSPETAEFIAYLLDNGLYDVEIRNGKVGGGYMTTFEKYRAPFIMANFDGTTENAYIMCHEGGHAFQGYLKRNEEIKERRSYTSETAETHAMSMEFFAEPYMKLFFGDRADDYNTMHLEDALKLIASECQQDEFQQLIYENPDMTSEERNAVWKRLDKEYFPWIDYQGNVNLQEGRRWQRITHMYQWPFYAIDYALAQVCALEYYHWMNTDFGAAWKSYLTFCRDTGTKSFPQLVADAGLDDPFKAETMVHLVNWLQSRLD